MTKDILWKLKEELHHYEGTDRENGLREIISRIENSEKELESVYEKLRELGPVYKQCNDCCGYCYEYVDLGDIFGDKAIKSLKG